MDVQRNLLESLRTYSTQPKKKANPLTQSYGLQKHTPQWNFTVTNAILQGRQAHTDLPLSHAAKVKMGITHAPRPTAEILCIKDKSLSTPTHDIPIGQNVIYREPTDRRWYPATVTQQLPQKRSYLIKTNDNVIYRKMQVPFKTLICLRR